MANVTELPPPEVLEAPDGVESPPTTAPTPPINKMRPGRGANKPEPRFFDRVASVAKEDWGTRAFMYVYADEPVCNPKTFGSTRYMLKSSAPILDLEGLKQDYGSFRGWMTLNQRKTGKDQTDEIDRYEFEIYDPKHPPKIPRSAWANDPRNKKWADLLPPEKPEPPNPAATLLESIKVYKEIRDDVREEVIPDGAEPSDHTKNTLETMKLAKELFAPPLVPPAPPSDPFDTAKKIMDMRSNDPMITLLLQRMDAQDKALEASRQREFDLLKEKNAAPKTDLIDRLFEFLDKDDKIEKVKKLLGLFGVNEATPGRSFRTTGFDVAREIFNSPFGANLGQGLGTWLSTLGSANGVPVNGTAPNPVPQFNPPGTESDQARIQRIASAITNPMINEFFDPGEPGDVFAERVFDMWPDDFRFLQRLGADTIVGLYREHNQQLWTHLTNHPKLGNREQAFRAFVKDFCTWNPDQEPVTAAQQPVDDGFTEDN
jgi:hypothetical protein